MKICIVDDDPLMLEALRLSLVALGHEPRPALTVATALAVVESGVDAAVVDILMPDRDGLEFITAARAEHPTLRIVAMSGGGRIGSGAVLSMARGLGANAVLAKPFSTSDLQMALQS